ncbi:helix-turn-helix domain-containing protein [Mycobacteroides abscessus]|uniref:helix-turn-helix domain-containing protein n=1 Tax=Mycobacteroides abscessus TaxID=36809 RepID=UPI00078C6DCA|nr:helix-turn-helix domain-containing protein [Mycobacteroides abscessus]QSM04143.1 hypothetical protein PROPHIGD51-2_5 [Mycobacterium phage prophiGD51-2]AMU55737.1 hypothetical protein A3O02_11585 [Mycobacteroides abscessus]MBE5436511.1 hypothetical protein [Mycobacteroides abscessus]MBN7447596.1 helix-turn-helix domain-containing protein [Mycobacteroides abscessus subsp. abscessus]MDM1901670.1 helix-turn-helix domain-containing protein [Mycobacteroides abscessus]
MKHETGFGTAEAARRSGRSQRTVQRAVAAGELVGYVTGKRSITIFESDLAAWMHATGLRPATAEEVE